MKKVKKVTDTDWQNYNRVSTYISKSSKRHAFIPQRFSMMSR